jgi:23S rRNA (pseudouridine1915-N3)-methyltransferase
LRIIVLAVGRLRPPYQDDVQHYQKLIAGHARVEMIEVREDERVPKRLPDRSFTVLLAADGKTFDSEGFSGFLEQRRQAGLDLVFVIGGPRGIDLEHCDMRLSLGPMTLPHQLARVVLLEQLYRGHKILAREPYHY